MHYFLLLIYTAASFAISNSDFSDNSEDIPAQLMDRYYEIISDNRSKKLKKQDIFWNVDDAYLSRGKYCKKQFDYNYSIELRYVGELKEIAEKSDIKGNIKNSDFALLRDIKDRDKDYTLHAFQIYYGPRGGERTENQTFYYFRSRYQYKSGESKNPLVLISPTIKGIRSSGIKQIESLWAKNFAREGINSIITSLEEGIVNVDRPIRKMDEWLIKQINGIRLVLDAVYGHRSDRYEDSQEDRYNLPLHKQLRVFLADDTDHDRIASFGASLGGIRTTILMALEPQRIKAGATVVAGGNFPDLWVNSNQKQVKEYRKARIDREWETFQPRTTKKMKKWEREREVYLNLHNYIRENTCTDPLLFTNLRENFNQDILMYLAGDDNKVPTKLQIELWMALGKPQAVDYLPIFNHRPALLWYSRRDKYKNRVSEFFKYRWGDL